MTGGVIVVVGTVRRCTDDDHRLHPMSFTSRAVESATIISVAGG